MHDLVILFAHTQQDEVTLRHLEILGDLNPHVPIIPLTFKAGQSMDGKVIGKPLDGSFDAAILEPRFASQNVWSAIDCVIYAWYAHGRTAQTTAHRYVYVEWDMLYRAPMCEVYAEVWDQDIASAERFFVTRHWHWNWFKEVYRLPPELRRFAAGIAPLAGTLVSDRLLTAIIKRPIPLNIFSELRLGTLACAAGFQLARLPDEKCRNLTWKQEFLLPEASPVYHPVKTLDHNLK